MNLEGRGRRADWVLIFGRYPVPGRTKTRLASAVGAVRAADWQRRLTERTVKTVSGAAEAWGATAAFAHAGGDSRRMRAWLGKGLQFFPQQGGHLGEGMRLAFAEAFQRGARRVVLVGSDIPDLRREHLGEALAALGECDVVLGPSRDGGYWLMGLRRPADLFGGIGWGSATVFARTLELARRQGLAVHRLPLLEDVDTVENLRHRAPAEALAKPYVSVIIPALNEEGWIAGAVRAAHDPEAEIIVADGESRDTTAAKAAREGARVVHCRAGRARQQNSGAAAALGAILLFVHADTRVPPGYPAEIFETLMDRRVALGAFSFRTDGRSELMRLVEAGANLRSRALGLPYGDQGLFVRREMFQRAGGFPETAIAEDLNLVRRLRRLGRIRTARRHAVTSARRWQARGVLRTTWTNQLVLAGLALGISQATLARIYAGTRRN